MAAGLIIKLHLIEEAAEIDDLPTNGEGEEHKARPAKYSGNIKTISRDSEFIQVYRLSEDLVNVLENDLSPYMRQGFRSTGFSKRLKILYALSFFANGSYQKIIGENVKRHVSQPSASRAIHEVVDALTNRNIISKYMKFPQNQNARQELQARFFEKFKIPGALGCLGGTLVSMIRPRKNDERYFCRKGYYTRSILIDTSGFIVSTLFWWLPLLILGALQLLSGVEVVWESGGGFDPIKKNITDADLNILHVDVTFGGSTPDSYIFANTRVKVQLEDLNNNGEKVYLLGDSGYPQTQYLMTPFNDPEDDSPEGYYNDLHSTALNTVEKTIQILKGRFRCLLLNRVLHYDPMMVGKLVIACCVLHNLCNRAGMPSPGFDIHDLDEESRLLGVLRQETETQDVIESGQKSRQDLANEIWQEHQNAIQELESCYQDALTIIS